MRKLTARSTHRSLLAALFAGALVTTFSAPVAAAPSDKPTLAPLRPGGPQTAADRYIVVLSDAPSGAGRAARAARIAAAAATAERAGGKVLTRYEHVLNGYAAYLPPAALAAVRADPSVAYVERDSLVRGGLTSTGVATARPAGVAAATGGAGAGDVGVLTDQTNPPSWGLDRIDQRSLPLDSTYSYDSTGSGVTVYVVDSGIRATHTDFGGRASGVYDAVGDGNGTNDCHGHGTHVAGTVAGATYGVAKGATIKAVRVLQCDNSGWTSDLIEGIDWITANAAPGSIANFSLQGYGTAPSDAVEDMIDAGIHAVFIANNYNTDACTNGPRSPRGITVGAVDITDTRASFSSWGPCVDVFAPGVNITSAGITSDTAVASGWNGTSMAAPHVAGWLARYLELHPTATIAQAKTDLIAATTKHAVNNPGPGSPNRLLYADPDDILTTADTQAPTAPGQPTASNVTATSVDLSWSASTDNVGVVSYDVYRNGTLAAQTTTNSVTISDLWPSTTYSFTVRARDADENISDPSPAAIVTTQATSLSCQVSYQVTSTWNPGFSVTVTITNTGTTNIDGWTLAWNFAAGEQLVSGYNATWSQNGTQVTATNLDWNKVLYPSTPATLGFQGTHSGSTPTPTSITLNGVPCTT